MCRLLSCTFLHAGVLHLGLNCLALYNIGPDVEAVFGYASFGAIYLLAGLAGSTASLLCSDTIAVGASGAIFGLLGEFQGFGFLGVRFCMTCEGRRPTAVLGMSAVPCLSCHLRPCHAQAPQQPTFCATGQCRGQRGSWPT